MVEIGVLKALVLDLDASFLEMASIVEEEKEIIFKNDIEISEGLLKRKQVCSDKISRCVDGISSVGKRLEGVLPSRSPLNTLSQIVDHVMSVPFEYKNLANNILLYAQNDLRGVIDHFYEVRNIVTPKIEQNVYLVQKLLVRHREYMKSLRMAAATAESLYGADGIERTSKNSAVFEVKA